MIQIRNIQPADFFETGEMIKMTLRRSFKDLYPGELIDAFCKKYDLENFKEKVKEIDYFIAEDDKKIIGIIGLKDNELRTFFVHSGYQGKSVGTKLYNHLEKEAKSRGIGKLILEGSPKGQPVYQHFGFKKVKSIIKERDGIKFEDAVMEKALDEE